MRMCIVLFIFVANKYSIYYNLQIVFYEWQSNIYSNKIPKSPHHRVTNIIIITRVIKLLRHFYKYFRMSDI